MTKDQALRNVLKYLVTSDILDLNDPYEALVDNLSSRQLALAVRLYAKFRVADLAAGRADDALTNDGYDRHASRSARLAIMSASGR
jgi:hypothetical protein